MGWKSKYDVEFKGLKEGLHEFNFEANKKFFEHFEQSLVSIGNVEIIVELEKRSSFLKLFFKIKGWVELTCDRCLESYQQKIKNKSEVFVKFSETIQEDDIDVIWILPEEHKLNLTQLIYELIMLSIPLKKIHPKNKKGIRACDNGMIERLNAYTNPHPDENKATDPRWDKLKNLKNNN